MYFGSVTFHMPDQTGEAPLGGKRGFRDKLALTAKCGQRYLGPAAFTRTPLLGGGREAARLARRMSRERVEISLRGF